MLLPCFPIRGGWRVHVICEPYEAFSPPWTGSFVAIHCPLSNVYRVGQHRILGLSGTDPRVRGLNFQERYSADGAERKSIIQRYETYMDIWTREM